MLTARLLQSGLQGIELAQVVEIDEPQAGDYHDPRPKGAHQERILYLGAQFAEDAEPIEQPLERVAAALAPLAGSEIDGDHWLTDPWVGVRLQCAGRGRSGASAGE